MVRHVGVAIDESWDDVFPVGVDDTRSSGDRKLPIRGNDGGDAPSFDDDRFVRNHPSGLCIEDGSRLENERSQFIGNG